MYIVASKLFSSPNIDSWIPRIWVGRFFMVDPPTAFWKIVTVNSWCDRFGKERLGSKCSGHLAISESPMKARATRNIFSVVREEWRTLLFMNIKVSSLQLLVSCAEANRLQRKSSFWWEILFWIYCLAIACSSTIQCMKQSILPFLFRLIGWWQKKSTDENQSGGPSCPRLTSSNVQKSRVSV